MSQLIIYYTEHCHLCDEAEALLHASGYGNCYTKVEIAYDADLLALYEIHIPVLKRADNGVELFWPFDRQQLAEFMETGR